MRRRARAAVVVACAVAFAAPATTTYALWSKTATGTLSVATLPAPPVLSCVAAVGTSLTWTLTGTTYKVYEYSNAAATTLLATTPIAAPPYTKTGFPTASNTTRWYRVSAVVTAGESTLSNIMRLRRRGSSATIRCSAP